MSVNNRFDQNRKDWATSADQLADQCFCEHFGVDRTDVYDVEDLVDGVHDRESGYQTHQILDYGGLDRIIDCGDRHVHVAQRSRPDSEYGTDLSIRVDNGVDDRHAELTKWVTAYETHGYYPDVISFGVYDEAQSKFVSFFLLDTAAILEALSTGNVIGEVHAKNDGTAARYITEEEFREAGAVIREWESVTPVKNTSMELTDEPCKSREQHDNQDNQDSNRRVTVDIRPDA